jgi:hypothetical protein
MQKRGTPPGVSYVAEAKLLTAKGARVAKKSKIEIRTAPCMPDRSWMQVRGLVVKQFGVRGGEIVERRSTDSRGQLSPHRRCREPSRIPLLSTLFIALQIPIDWNSCTRGNHLGCSTYPAVLLTIPGAKVSCSTQCLLRLQSPPHDESTAAGDGMPDTAVISGSA